MKPCLWLWLAIVTNVVSATNIVKRLPDRHYYTLHVPEVDHDTHVAAQHVARSLGGQFEGMVGELKTYYMMSVPKNSLNKRSQEENGDPVVAAFQARKRFNKRDENQRLWDRVQRLDPQVPRQRTKRAALPREPPFTEISKGQAIMEDAQRVLDIKDPGFPKQWHLVCNTHGAIVCM